MQFFIMHAVVSPKHHVLISNFHYHDHFEKYYDTKEMTSIRQQVIPILQYLAATCYCFSHSISNYLLKECQEEEEEEEQQQQYEEFLNINNNVPSFRKNTKHIEILLESTSLILSQIFISNKREISSCVLKDTPGVYESIILILTDFFNRYKNY